MASNALERRATWDTRLLGLLRPDPERLEFATRLALICSLTTLVAQTYQLPSPSFMAFFPLSLNRPERSVSLILSVAFLFIVTMVIALTVPIVKLVVNDPMWLLIAMAVISFVFLFLASASRLRGIGGSIALVIAYLLDLLSTAGAFETRLLLYVWLFVAIPAGVSVLVNLLLAPAPRHTVEQTITERLRLCAAVLRDPESSAREELAARVRDGMAPVLGELRLAKLEKSVAERDLGSLQQAALSCFALMSALDALASNPDVALPVAVRVKLADAVDQIAHGVQRGHPPVTVALELPEDETLTPLAQELLGAMRDALAHFAEPDTTGHAPPKKKKKPGFMADDAFSNPEHVHYALKTTAAAMFCYLLFTLLDWPGIHTSLLTCYIVAQGTAAESVRKLTLRIVGCLIGAAAGYAAIVFLMPNLTSIGGLMITVFIGGWVAAYVLAGGPRIGYAGLQIAIAFFMCIIQGSEPKFDLTTARDRIVGILLGNLVAYFAFVHVWPTSICRRVDPALAAAFKQLTKLFSATEPRERRLLASQAQGSLSKIEADIELAGYEPASIRSSPLWLSVRRNVVETSQSLGSLLLLSGDSSELSRVDVGRRLDRLATQLTSPSDTPETAPSLMPPAHGPQTLPARINQSLQALEETVAHGFEKTGASPYAHS
jgi:multidrug resistance protein MdtO